MKILKGRTKNPQTKNSRQSESGNVFFMLFGAVAIVGVLGAGIMATMRGPLSTMVEVNRRTQAEAEMNLAAKLALLESVQQDVSGKGGDCDTDNFVEPLPYDLLASGPVGGGKLPDDVASKKEDPWGTAYGYCTWDAGTVANNATCGAGANRLPGNGLDDQTYVVVAVISAGPDRIFQTTCTGGATPDIVKATGSDDFYATYNYAEAVASTGGLWTIDPGEADSAIISKNVDLTGVGQSFSPQLRLGAASMLFPTDDTLGTGDADCTGSNNLILRVNDDTIPPSLEICDGPNATWESVAGGASLWTDLGSNRIFYGSSSGFKVGIGTDDPQEALDVAGNIQLTDNLLLEADSSLIWGTSGVSLKEDGGDLEIVADSALTIAIFTGNDLTITDTLTSLLNDVEITGTTSDATKSALFVKNSNAETLLQVQNDKKVGLGMTPDDALDVDGNIGLKGDVEIDDTHGVMWGADTGLFGMADTSLGLNVNATTILGLTTTGADVTGKLTVSDDLEVSDIVKITGDTSDGSTHVLDILDSGTNNVLYIDTNGKLMSSDEIEASGDIRSSSGDLYSAGTIFIDNNIDLEPRDDCDADTEKLIWTNTGWDCADVGASGTGTGGALTLEDVLDGGNSAEGYDAEDFGQLGAQEFCNEDLSVCFDPEVIANTGSVVFRVTGAAGSEVVNQKDSVAPYATSDFVFGSPTLDYTSAGTRFFFDKSKGAFRAGIADGSSWNNVNVGNFSVAFGKNTTASGESATAFGVQTTASGYAGTAFGIEVKNGGDYGLAMGLGDTSAADDTEYPEITGAGDGSIAFFMGDQKNVDVTTANIMALIGGKMIINPSVAGGAGTDTSPATGGAQDVELNVLGDIGATNYCDAAGNNCFTPASIAGGGIWEDASNVIRPTSGVVNYASADFLFGSPTMDYTTDASRMFFNKAKRAFRAGSSDGSWNNASVGYYSVAFGDNTTADNTFSMAWGGGSTASGESSTAWGGATASGLMSTAWVGAVASGDNSTAWNAAIASGDYSTAWGNAITASGESSTAFGTLVSAGNGTPASGDGDYSIAAGLQSAGQATPPTVTGDRSMVLFFDKGVADANSGYDFTDSDKFAIIGGEFQIDDQSSTANKGCIRYDSTSSKLQFSNNCSAYSDILGSGNLAAAAPTRSIQFNSGGQFSGDATLVYTSAGRLGLGTATPGAKLTVFSNNGAGNYTALFSNNQATGHGVAIDTLNNSASYFGLRVNHDSGARTDFTVNGDGKVGIGDATPDHMLDVAGNIGLNASSYINFGDTDGTAGYGIRDNAGTVECKNSSGSWAACADGNSGTPAGSDRQIQFNSGSAFGASSTLVFTSAGRLGVGTGAPATDLEIVGALRLSGTTTDSYITPVGSIVPTKINIPDYDPGAFGQLLSIGIPSGASTTARVVSVFDARTVAHQPSIGLFSPSENDIIGLSWDGSDSVAALKTLTSDISFRINTTDIMNLTAGGFVGIGDSTPDIGTGGQLYLDVNGPIGGTKYCDENGNNCFTAASAAGGVPGAPDRAVQFNSGGQFSGDATLVYTSAGRLGIGTSNPGNPLDIYSGGNTYMTVRGPNTNVQLGINNMSYGWVGTTTNNPFRIGANAGTSAIFATDGSVGIGDLTPDQGGEQPLLLDVEGSVGAINYCDAAGNNCFTAASVAGGGIWEDASNVIRPTSGVVNYASADFLFGSPQQDDDGDNAHESRMFFDKSKSAFRAGKADGVDRFDDSRVGVYSSAFGYNNEASGQGAVAWGNWSGAWGNYATVWGSGSWASGAYATAWGSGNAADAQEATAFGRKVNVTNTATRSVGIGMGDATVLNPRITAVESLGIFMGDQGSSVLSTSHVMALIGGKMIINPSIGGGAGTDTSPATGGAQDVELNVLGDIGATNYCDADGNNCFQPANVGDTSAADPVRSVQFNSGGEFSGDASFVFTSAGRLGVGTGAPSYLLSLGGNSARTIGMERHTTADTAGNSLSILAGGATTGSTDRNGGDLILNGGYSTGTGDSNIAMYVYNNGVNYEIFRAEGNGTNVEWGRSDSNASGTYSTAWGVATSATTNYSTAWGFSAQSTGDGSTAWGASTTASQTWATAWGNSTTSSGGASTAWGNATLASNSNSTAFGLETRAEGAQSLAIGLGDSTGSGNQTTNPKVTAAGSMGIFMGDQENVNITTTNLMALMGGKLIIDPDTTSAANTVPSDGSGSGGQVLAVDVTGAVGANYFCDQNGLNCFTSASVTAGGTPSSPVRSIQFNSGGQFSGDATLVYTSAGHLGIGTAAPGTKLTVQETYGAGRDFFKVTDNLSNTHLVVDQWGNLGVGTVPGAKLSVFSNNGAGYYTALFSSNQATGHGVAIDTLNNSASYFGLRVSHNSGARTDFTVNGDGNVGIGNTAPGALLDIGLAGTTLGTMRLEGSTSGYVQIQPPVAAGSWTMTLPSSAGSNGYVLSTNGSGVTTWSPASGLISGLGAAGATNTIDNTNYTQTWNWSTLNTQTALALGVDAITSGKALDITSTATAFTGTMANFGLSGSNASNTGSVVKTSITGTSSTGTPLMVTNLGAGLSMRVNDETGDADTTPFVINATGDVGIATATPTYNLSLGGTAARTIGMEANAAAAAGQGLTVRSGSSGAGTNLTGGDLVLQSGASTGNTYSNIIFNVPPSSASGTGANAAAEVARIYNWGLAMKLDRNLSFNSYFDAATGAPRYLEDGEAFTISHADGAGLLAFAAAYEGTAGDPVTFVDAMTIDKGAKVGIGLPSSSLIGTRLHVRETSTTGNAALEVLRLQHDDTDTGGSNGLGASLSFTGESNSNGVFPEMARVEAVMTDVTNASKDSALLFYTLGANAGAGSNTATEKMRITSAGNVGIGNTAPGALLDIGLAGTTLGTMRLEGSTSGYVQIQPPVAAGSWTMTLPSSAGSNGYVLSTNGSGVTTWSPASGLISGLGAAGATNTIDNTNYTQTWNWSTLNTQTALALGVDAITSGKALDITSTATAFTGTMANFGLSGSNASNTGSVVKTSITGTSSTGTPLMVTNLGAGLSMRVNDETGDADTTPFVINATGNVGIGMTAPTAPLDVTKAVSNGKVAYFYNSNAGTGSPSDSGIDVRTWTAGGVGYVARFDAFDGTYAGNVIEGYVYGSNVTGNLLGLYRGNNADYDKSNPVLIVKGAGNVGIGTASPDNPLVIEKNQNASTAFRVRNTTSGTGARAGLLIGTDTSAFDVTIDAFSTGYTASGGDDVANSGRLLASGSGGFSFRASNGAIKYFTGSTERMRIDTSGNVGIGTTSPDNPLVIEKNQNASTAFRVRNTTSGTGARAGLLIGTDTSAYDVTIDAFSTGYTASGGDDVANSGRLLASGSGGFAFRASNGAIKYFTGSTERMRIDTSGYVGINNTSPSVALDVTGDIEYTGTIADVSDIRLKKDIVPLDKRGSMLEKLGQVETYSFVMKDDKKGRTEFGVIAQELEKIFPELVRTDDDEMKTKSVNYVGLIAPLIKAGQELEAENQTMKAELASLKANQAQVNATLTSLNKQVELLNINAGKNVGKAGLDIWSVLAMLGAIFGAGGAAFAFYMFGNKSRKSFE